VSQVVRRVASPYSVPRLVVLVRASQPPAFALDQGKSRRVDDPSDGSFARLPTLNQLRSWAYRVNAWLSLQPLAVTSRCWRGPDACQRLIIIGVEVIAGIESITRSCCVDRDRAPSMTSMSPRPSSPFLSTAARI
jgi:hypothetical protein